VGGVESDPDVEFNHNQGFLRGVRLSDGRFAVIDVVRVHYFDAKGQRLKIVGRQGSGPEEFRYLTNICRTRGDTLFVSDLHNNRLAVLDNTATVVRTIPLAGVGIAMYDFCFADGTLLLQRMLGDPAAPTRTRPLRLTRLRTDGSVANVIGEIAGRSSDWVTQHSSVAVAAGQRLYYGDGSTSQIQIYGLTGKLIGIVRSDDALIRISDADVEKRLRLYIPPNVSASERTERTARMRAMPHTDTWPAYGNFHVDATGRLWVQEYRMVYPAPDGWTAFDSTGRLIGRLVVPGPRKGEMSFEVIDFGIDDILVRRRDAEGAAHLTVYPILRIDGRGP
jgi:hypothetical protein